MNRKLIFKTILCCLVLTLVSCSKNKPVVSILLYNESDTYIRSVRDNLLEEMPDTYDVNVYDCKNSQSEQTRLFLKALDKTDIFLINIYDRANAKDIILKIKETTNVPIVFFNREVSIYDMKLVDNAYYVGSDSINAGQIQAELYNEQFIKAYNNGIDFDTNKNGKIETIVLKGENQHQDAENRTQYSLERLEELGYSIDTQGIYTCDWSREKAFESAKKIMAEHPDVELVLANNDDMALGLIDYLRNELKLFDFSYAAYAPIKIIGFDGTAQGKTAIENGVLLGTVLNDSLTQAQLVVGLTKKLLEGETSITDVLEYKVVNERFLYSTSTMITKDTLN